MNRYILTLRYQLALDWKRQLAFTGTLTVLLFMIFWVMSWVTGSADASIDPASQRTVQGMYAFVKILAALTLLSLAIGYNSAHSMPFMSSKTAHIAYLTLPASTAVKYAVTQTRALLLSLVETLLALLLSELFVYLLTGIWSMGSYFAIDWDTFSPTGNSASLHTLFNLIIWICAVMTLLYSAWFTLCATLFRRHPFLYGVLILWGVQQLFQVASIAAFPSLAGLFDGIASSFSGVRTIDALIPYGYWAIAALLLLSLLLWLISYHRLRRAAIDN